MKYSSLVAFLFVGSSLVTGCAASVDGNDQGSQGSVEQSSAAAASLTVAQCATQRDQCFANNPLFGLFVCPAQYAQCTTTASNGVPAQVTSAISDAADCTKTFLACSNDANTADKLAACTATEAECVASIVQVKLPPVVTGTATCVDNSVKCINAAQAVSDLTTCANNLESCAVTQAQSVLPPQVGQVVGGVSQCETTLNSCVAAAQTPAALTKCGQDSATCVADQLGVALPTVSVTGVVDCATTAANCALESETVAAVGTCADNLLSCAKAQVSTTTPPQQTCQQKWTACLAKNPLNFLGCGADFAACK